MSQFSFDGLNSKYKQLKTNNKAHIVILCNNHLSSIYKQLYKWFTLYKFPCKYVVYNINSPKLITNSSDIYIGEYTSLLHTNSTNYIFLQIEQYVNHFTTSYIKMMNNAKFILEYSPHNFYLYKKFNINFKNVIYSPFIFQPLPQITQMTNWMHNLNSSSNSNSNPSKFEYDLAFYGLMSPRRTQILNYLKSQFRVLVIPQFNTFCKHSLAKLHKCAFLLNIHCYQMPAILEVPRIHEGILNNIRIISESEKITTRENAIYNNYVDYIDIVLDNMSNIAKITQQIKRILDKINSNVDTTTIPFRHDTTLLVEHSNFIFSRTIVATQLAQQFNLNSNITFNLISKTLKNENEVYVLSLSETPSRLTAFYNQNANLPSHTILNGVKMLSGRTGCATSYVNIIRSAKMQNVNRITVCEDDCLFPSNFVEIYKTVIEFITVYKKQCTWDIFCGLIAELPTNVQILQTYTYNNITFIKINKFMSTVFNIYNKSSFNYITNWSPKIHESTIDRYINKSNMTYIVAVPFIVSIINVPSTIFAFNANIYAMYCTKIKKTELLLKQKVQKQLKRQINPTQMLIQKYKIKTVNNKS